MARPYFIAGNWKMHTTASAAAALADAVVAGVPRRPRLRVALCPPYPYLAHVAARLHDSDVTLGAQNVYPAHEGAFTGEVSPAMLLDVGCRHVIIGHSERRHVLHESDDLINRKTVFALAEGLSVILCVGETLEEREANQTEAVLDRQLTSGMRGLPGAHLERLTLAYEPVWAIGTGKNATPEQAQAAHSFLRGRAAELYGKPRAEQLVIQYGGSVKPANAAAILAQPDVDGALVGGASLNAAHFLAIIRAAADLLS